MRVALVAMALSLVGAAALAGCADAETDEATDTATGMGDEYCSGENAPNDTACEDMPATPAGG